MNVLYAVIHGEIAGGQIVCLQIIEALVREGHQALVISPSEGPFTDLLRKKKIPVFIIPFEKTYFFHRAFQVTRLLRNQKVDLVHSHGTVQLNIHVRLAARLIGIPCISHIHSENVFSSHWLIRQYQIFLDRFTSQLCYRLIAVSKATKESLIQEGIEADRIEVIPNGIDSDRLNGQMTRAEVFQRFQIDPKKQLVTTIGSLCPNKGQEEFLKAAKQVNVDMPNTVWMMIGKDIEFKGAYEAKLKMLAQNLGLNGQVIFTGYQDDPLSLLNACDLFVLPSKREGMPLVVLEAAALKKAVIASAVGGIPEVVQDGETGILIPPGDSQALGLAMLKLLRDPKLARTMGEAGFRRIREHFSECQMVHRTLKLYQEVSHAIRN